MLLIKEYQECSLQSVPAVQQHCRSLFTGCTSCPAALQITVHRFTSALHIGYLAVTILNLLPVFYGYCNALSVTYTVGPTKLGHVKVHIICLYLHNA